MWQVWILFCVHAANRVLSTHCTSTQFAATPVGYGWYSIILKGPCSHFCFVYPICVATSSLKIAMSWLLACNSVHTLGVELHTGTSNAKFTTLALPLSC